MSSHCADVVVVRLNQPSASREVFQPTAKRVNALVLTDGRREDPTSPIAKLFLSHDLITFARNAATLLHHLYAGHSLKRKALFAPAARLIVHDREQRKEVTHDHEQQDQGHDVEPLVLVEQETELTLLNNDQSKANRTSEQEGEV